MATMTVSKALELAREHLKAGRVMEAIDVCRAIMIGAPEAYEVYLLLASIGQGSGNLEMALEFSQRAVGMAPRDPQCYITLAATQRARGNWAEAETAARTALMVRPDSAEAEEMLARVLQGQGRAAEAEAAYRRALALNPNLVDALVHLAMFLNDMGRRDEAEVYARHALRIQPDNATAANTLGNILQMTVRMAEAAAAYRQALAASPLFPEAHTNLGSALQAMGRLEEARAAYARAVELRPTFAGAHSNLLACLQNLVGVTQESLLAEHVKWDEQHMAALRNTWRPHANSRDPHRRLRVGFVSADLGRHPVGYFTVGLFEMLDHARVQSYCYSDRLGPDEITQRVQQACDVWRDTRNHTDAAVAEQIRADQIDILFDLGAHTAMRFPMFGLKPAPIQISWIGYVGTTGVAAIDYVLGDRYQIQEGDERYYRERVLRMPDGYVCYNPPAYAPPVGPLPALRRGHVTFASFNRLAKINDEVVSTWAQILTRVPSARLVMQFRGLEDAPTKEDYWQRFAAHGIDRSRIDLRGGVSHMEMLARYNEVDIALDSFPYSGGLITCEALWMGVPVVTFPGATFAGRHALSHLTNAGFPELVAPDRDGYVELAVRLASDPVRLAELRARMRPQMATSPLCDNRRFAANFMDLLEQVWRRWIAEDSGTPVSPAEPPPMLPPSALPLDPQLNNVLEEAGEHFRCGRLQEAEAAVATVLRSAPDCAPALRVQGLILAAKGDRAQAIACIERAITLLPGIAEWHDNLGALHGLAGHNAQAEAACREALRLDPQNVSAWNNLGMALRGLHRVEEAEEAHRAGLAIDPTHLDCHLNLGTVLLSLGFPQRAADEYRRCLELRSDWPEVRSNLLLAQQYLPGVTPASLAAAHADWEQHQGAPLRSAWRPHANRPDPERRLRLGFVSQDFNSHPAGFLFVRLIESLDRSQVDTFCYSDVKMPDEITAQIRAAAGRWLDLGDRDHAQVAEQIRQDEIDILFDLSGHTAGNRLPVFARKPAPIQITWIGYVGTTGLTAMDYLLADRHQVAPGTECYYTEKVLRMPDGYVCWCPPARAPQVAPPPYEIQGHITFGSFNNPAKVHDGVLRVWAEILRRVPDSRLMLRYMGLDGPKTQRRIREAFVAAGVDPARIQLFGWSHHTQMLGSYNQVDIGLDSFPYSGGVTTCEALWMGVPVVTCPGETFASRHSLSHLSTVGFTETIARDLDHYVELAVGLATDRQRLGAIRAGLRAQVAASPLVDGPRFAGHFLRLLRDVWHQWCKGR
jgi:predicted O-linked N-acetylglucosamine transferase (SPINDLY family)